MKTFILILSVIIFGQTFGQINPILKLPKTEFNVSGNQSQIVFLNNNMFVVNENNSTIYLFDPITKKLNPFLSSLRIKSNLIEKNGQLYFVNEKSSNRQILRIDSNLQVHEVFNASSDFCRIITLYDKYLFFEDKIANSYYTYALNTENQVFVYLFYTGVPISEIGKLGDKLLLSKNHNYTNVYQINPDLNFDLYTFNFNWDSLYFVQTNDPSRLIMTTSSRLLEVDLPTLSVRRLGNEKYKSMEFLTDSTFIGCSPNNQLSKGKIVNDTLVSNELIRLKSNYQSLTYSPSFLKDKKYSMIHEQQFGYELFYLNDEDSLDLLVDFAPGILNGIKTTSYCNGITPNYFYFKDTLYFVFSDGVSSSTLLYKVFDNQYISIFDLELDVLSNVHFYPTDDKLVWTTRSQGNQNRLVFERFWSDSIDFTPTYYLNNEWIKEIHTYIPQYSCYSHGNSAQVFGIEQDKSKNTFIAISNFSNEESHYLQFLEYNESFAKDTVLSEYILKLDTNGKILWFNTFGQDRQGWSHKNFLLMDQSENPVVFGIYGYEALFDSDTLANFGCTNYFARFDKETGKVIDKKRLTNAVYLTDLVINDVKQDKSGNYYLIGHYEDFEGNFMDTVLYSDFSKQNFLIKLDANGDFQWARNIRSRFTDYFCEAISLDIYNNILSIHSLTNDYFMCDEVIGNNELFFLDLDGNEIKRNYFKFDGTRGTAFHYALENGNYVYLGDFSKSFEAFPFLQENSQVSCNSSTRFNYSLIFDQEKNGFNDVFSTKSDDFFSQHLSKKIGNKIYVLGFNKIGFMVLHRFDLAGNYEGNCTIEIKLTSDARSIHFYIEDNYIILSGTDFYRNLQFGIDPSYFRDNYLSILKFKLPAWEMNDSYYKQMEMKFVSESNPIHAFPNPSTDLFEIIFDPNEAKYTDFSVFDLMGRSVLSGKIEDEPFIRFNLENESQGVYIVELKNESTKHAVKIIKN